MIAHDLTTLSHQYRRKTIELLEEKERAEFDEIIKRCANNSEATEREVRATLYHNHLPHLASADVISWNDADMIITDGPRFQQVASNLDTLGGLVT